MPNPQDQMPEASEPQPQESAAELAMKVSGELQQLIDMSEDDSVKQQLQSCKALIDGMSGEEKDEAPVSEQKSKGYVSANGGVNGVPLP